MPLAAIYEINERYITLSWSRLHETKGIPLRGWSTLRSVLPRISPEMRTRAAERALLLVEMAFRDVEWWKDARRDPKARLPNAHRS